MIRSRLFAAIVLMVCFNPAQALTWEDLWLNQDQQAYNALTQNNPQQAASLFKSPQWQGAAYYRMGNYQKALLAFMKANDATAWYNRGNALAHLGQYQEAIRAYDKALALDPHFEDARFNENLLKQLLNNSGSASAPPETRPPETASQERSPPPFKQNYKNKKNNPNNNATDTSPQNNTESPAKPSPVPGSSPPPPTESTPAPTASYESQQQQQSMQNMSDDPGGLLQRKLSRDYARSQQQGD